MVMAVMSDQLQKNTYLVSVKIKNARQKEKFYTRAYIHHVLQ